MTIRVGHASQGLDHEGGGGVFLALLPFRVTKVGSWAAILCCVTVLLKRVNGLESGSRGPAEGRMCHARSIWRLPSRRQGPGWRPIVDFETSHSGDKVESRRILVQAPTKEAPSGLIRRRLGRELAVQRPARVLWLDPESLRCPPCRFNVRPIHVTRHAADDSSPPVSRKVR
ncbi:hypothetical protein N658DRAFT_206578 [Parathielavia hyrcaniae]|uniref:Uncharacterized protein n=1 Tax=Parathielavia hyrcaniae TaxID=113614 RepID=A0AAN6PXH9_9PEZI|nr:hypothetical protein N658DRAFT_206578 [Parathielavia hyrcaniae]